MNDYNDTPFSNATSLSPASLDAVFRRCRSEADRRRRGRRRKRVGLGAAALIAPGALGVGAFLANRDNSPIQVAVGQSSEDSDVASPLDTASESIDENAPSVTVAGDSAPTTLNSESQPANWIWEPTHLAPTDVSVSWGAFASTDSYYFTVGGVAFDGTPAVGYTLNLANGQWVPINDFGLSGVEDLTAVAVNNEFVVVGGWTSGTRAVAKFSPVTREWTSLGDLPVDSPRVETVAAVASRPNHVGLVVDEYDSEDRASSERIARTFFELSLETGEIVTTSRLSNEESTLLITPASDFESMVVVEAVGPDVVGPALGSISIFEVPLGESEPTPTLVTQVDGFEAISVTQLRPDELVVQQPTNILTVSLLDGSSKSAPADTLRDDACRGGMAQVPSGVVAWDCYFNVLEFDSDSFAARTSLEPAGDNLAINPGQATASPTGRRIVFRQVDESGTTFIRPASHQS